MSTLVTEVVSRENISAPPASHARKAEPPKINPKQIFKAAEDSAEFFDHLRAHYRETRRTIVAIECEIKLILSDGSIFDSGSGTVRNVSPSGALIGTLKLGKNCLPLSGYKVVLQLKGGDYNGIVIEATPVRIASEAGGLGVRFDEIFVTV